MIEILHATTIYLGKQKTQSKSKRDRSKNELILNKLLIKQSCSKFCHESNSDSNRQSDDRWDQNSREKAIRKKNFISRW